MSKNTTFYKVFRDEDGFIVNIKTLKPKVYKDLTKSVRFSGGNYSQALKCPGSILIESDTTKEAKKGKDIHTKAEKLILQNISAHFFRYISKIGNTKLDSYVKCVLDFITDKTDLFGIETYLRVRLPGTKSVLSGVIDFWFYNDHDEVLYIVDLKTGAYKVSPEYNKQMLFYYVLLKKTILKNKPIRELNIGIYTLNEERLDEKVYKDDSLHIVYEETLNILKLLDPSNEKLVVGDHCVGCFKFSNCPAYLNYLKKLYTEYKKQQLYVASKGTKVEDVGNLFVKQKALKPHINKVAKLFTLNADKGLLDSYVDKVISKTTTVWKNKEYVIKNLPSATTRKLKNPKTLMDQGFKVDKKHFNTKEIYTYHPMDSRGEMYKEMTK